MNASNDFHYFQGNSFSELYAQDTKDASYAFILNYPTTAGWAAFPNKSKYLIQDGSDEYNKISYDKLFQKEAWKNLAVLGDTISGITVSPPPNLLFDYWRQHFGYSYNNIHVIPQSVYLDYLNQNARFDKFITLFPFDALQAEKHAVAPDVHYHLLSKATLSSLGVQCPKYTTYNLNEVNINDIKLPEQYPYLIKVSHGLSGEGTYIIKTESDLNYCHSELKKYLASKSVSTIVVSEFVNNVVQNYCVQFYISKTGNITLIGTASQLVTEEGNYLGGIINYRQTDMSKFFTMITAIGEYAHQKGYFGAIGFDVLEDRDGELYVIDANFRVNGSTPLCLQRHNLLKLGKGVAKYSSDYRIAGTLESTFRTLQSELENSDFIILSAQEINKGSDYTDIYGIIAANTIHEIKSIEQKLQQKGLLIV
jgi:ATP-grasp domain